MAVLESSLALSQSRPDLSGQTHVKKGAAASREGRMQKWDEVNQQQHPSASWLQLLNHPSTILGACGCVGSITRSPAGPAPPTHALRPYFCSSSRVMSVELLK